MSYATRVTERLGPYSVSRSFPQLLREWYATGQMIDVEDAAEECDVCGHEHIRYLFQIKNTHNGNALEKSGSKCILKFPEIGVLVGQRITYDPVEKEAALAGIVERHKKKKRALIRKEFADQVWEGLQNVEHERAPIAIMRDISAQVYRDPESNASLSPKQFSLLTWAAQLTNVPLPIAAFQGIINLRKGRAKAQLAELTERQIQSISGALTPSQRAILAREREAKATERDSTDERRHTPSILSTTAVEDFESVQRARVETLVNDELISAYADSVKSFVSPDLVMYWDIAQSDLQAFTRRAFALSLRTLRGTPAVDAVLQKISQPAISSLKHKKGPFAFWLVVRFPDGELACIPLDGQRPGRGSSVRS